MPKSKATSSEKVTKTPEPATLGSFTLMPAEIRDAIARLKPAMSRAGNLPVLKSLLISRHDGETILVADSLEVRAIHTIPSGFPPPASALARQLLANRSARENCLFALDLSDLSTAVSACDRTEPVRITAFRTPGKETDTYTAQIDYIAKGVTIRKPATAYDPAEFPPARCTATPQHAVTFDTTARDSFFKALEASSTDDTRYVLNGVLLDPTGEHHAAIGTDGRQLVQANGFRLPFASQVIIPNHAIFGAKHLRESAWTMHFAIANPSKYPAARVNKTLDRILAALQPFLTAAEQSKEKRVPAEMVERYNVLQRRKIAVERYRDLPIETEIRLECGRTKYSFRAVEGNYPNYRQVIPDLDEAGVTLPLDEATRRKILDVVPALPPVGREDIPSIALQVDLEHVSLSCGATTIPLTVTPRWKAEAKAFRVSLNRQYLLRAARYGYREAKLSTPMDPVVFLDGPSKYVTMPLRVNG